MCSDRDDGRGRDLIAPGDDPDRPFSGALWTAHEKKEDMARHGVQ